MAYNEREKKRKKKKKFRGLLISTIFLYLIFRSVPALLASNAKTILPERDTLINKQLVQGFIIKDETIVRATGSGDLELFSEEGVRLSSGSKVANISSINNSSSLKQELEQIEKSIIALEKSEADAKTMIQDKEKIEGIKEELERELQESINEGKFEEIYLLKEKLVLYNGKSDEVAKTDTLIGQSLENLKLRKEIIDKDMDSNHINYYTNYGGIVSYKLDGYEEIYIPKDFENYSYDKLNIGNIKIKDVKVKSKIEVDEPIFKIIDNFEWYMGIKIEDIKEIEQYEIGDVIRIEIEEDKPEILGRIISINNSKNKSVLIVKFNTKLHEHYNERFPEVYLIKSKFEGLKIPDKSIVEKDSIKGVYIKDTSGIVRFRPVNIIGEDDKFVYVEMGNSSSHINVEGVEEPVKTISIYDEIFINTNNVKEGQILN